MKKEVFNNENGQCVVYSIDNDHCEKMHLQKTKIKLGSGGTHMKEYERVLLSLNELDTGTIEDDEGRLHLFISKYEAIRMAEALLSIANSID